MKNTSNSGDTRRIRTLCTMCPVRGGIIATVENGKVTKIEGDPQHPISRGYICDKGLPCL